MSWSIVAKGTAQEIAGELEKYRASLSGQSQIEFDDARPAIETLLMQNFEHREHLPPGPRMVLNAYGSGAVENGRQLYRNCTVRLEGAGAG